jgi:hypothetical protein
MVRELLDQQGQTIGRDNGVGANEKERIPAELAAAYVSFAADALSEMARRALHL